MFGFFEKKAVDNNEFNKMVIAALGETVTNLRRIPTENEFYSSFNHLLESKKGNISPAQFNSIKLCALSLQMGFGDEVLPLIKQLNIEAPQGIHISYEKIFEQLCMRAILVSEDSLEFMKKFQ